VGHSKGLNLLGQQLSPFWEAVKLLCWEELEADFPRPHESLAFGTSPRPE
jgi:hypothetical protein